MRRRRSRTSTPSACSGSGQKDAKALERPGANSSSADRWPVVRGHGRGGIRPAARVPATRLTTASVRSGPLLARERDHAAADSRTIRFASDPVIRSLLACLASNRPPDSDPVSCVLRCLSTESRVVSLCVDRAPHRPPAVRSAQPSPRRSRLPRIGGRIARTPRYTSGGWKQGSSDQRADGSRCSSTRTRSRRRGRRFAESSEAPAAAFEFSAWPLQLLRGWLAPGCSCQRALAAHTELGEGRDARSWRNGARSSRAPGTPFSGLAEYPGRCTIEQASLVPELTLGRRIWWPLPLRPCRVASSALQLNRSRFRLIHTRPCARA